MAHPDTKYIIAILMERLQEAVGDANNPNQLVWKLAAQAALGMAREAGFTPIEEWHGEANFVCSKPDQT